MYPTEASIRLRPHSKNSHFREREERRKKMTLNNTAIEFWLFKVNKSKIITWPASIPKYQRSFTKEKKKLSKNFLCRLFVYHYRDRLLNNKQLDQPADNFLLMTLAFYCCISKEFKFIKNINCSLLKYKNIFIFQMKSLYPKPTHMVIVMSLNN